MLNRISGLASIALLSVWASGCIITTDDDSTLTIANESDFVLVDIRVAEVNDLDYGPNLLGGDVLLPDESITVELDCGDYDALVVDELDTECELFDLDLCFDDAVWVIDNFELDTCDF